MKFLIAWAFAVDCLITRLHRVSLPILFDTSLIPIHLLIARHLAIPPYQLGIDIAFSRSSTRVRTALCPPYRCGSHLIFAQRCTRAKRHLGDVRLCREPLAGSPHA